MNEDSLERVLKLRWIVLVMMGVVVFGCYYAYDSVVPIADQIIKDMDVTRAQYGLLFSYYSFPNLLMVLLGGMFLDKFGIRKAGSIFVTLCVIGVFMTAVGGTRSFQLMLWGRLLYGIGAESLSITQIKVMSKWFKGKELAFAMGLYITLVRLGNFASLNLGAPIQSWSGSWKLALWVAFGTIVISFVVFMIYRRLDKAKEANSKREKMKLPRKNSYSVKSSNSNLHSGSSRSCALRFIRRFCLSLPFPISSSRTNIL